MELSKHQTTVLTMSSERVAFFVVLTQIQPHLFFLFRYAETHDGFQNGKEDQSADSREHPRHDHCNQLSPKLPGIAEEKTVIARGVDCFRGKQASRQRAPGSADSVHADNVQGIVIAKFRF